jgi:glycosyltransferase involved in cell wall biosynthesis
VERGLHDSGVALRESFEHPSSDGGPGVGRQPLVSVLVPVPNGERYQRESLDSILAQTYPKLDVIVMDDGSTDRTAEIVASYGAHVPYVRQPSTRGIYGNANDGIERAAGELMGVFHPDDVYLPKLVEREVGDRDASRQTLGELRLRVLAGNPALERAGLVLLTVAAPLLTQAPWLPAVARIFGPRWNAGFPPTPSGAG